MYFIYCGVSIYNVTFVCDHIKHKARLGTTSGSTKQITREITSLGKTVFVCVVAADNAGIKGALSNIVQVYVEDPDPTTTEQPATTGLSNLFSQLF